MAFSTLPSDYEDRVYGGVLGKVIGVYLGRPFEQWSHQAIVEKLGEVDYYVNDKLGVPLVVADDDISGTFTFLRALEDNDFDPNLTPEQIGETWLNYIIENRTVLWWGGRSTSTEHTAFLNLKAGIKAPESGSIAVNGKTVAEQIGAQIFIDGWGLIHPGDPEAAADWARRAASVSHDGEAIYGAQVIASMISGAFIEQDLTKLQDMALAQVPADCQIRRLVEDVRELVAREADWHKGFLELDDRYGYHRYQGACHIIPNHGLIHFALLHGEGDFRHSMRVVNTCGWDTDCNAGNLGCILGVRNGWESLREDQPSWVKPFGGRAIIPTADGGGYATHVGHLVERVCRAARKLRGVETQVAPQWTTKYTERGALETMVRTFASPEELAFSGYGIQASPWLYPGQTVRVWPHMLTKAKIEVFARRIDPNGKAERVPGPRLDVGPETLDPVEWTLPGPASSPIFEVGVELVSFDDNFRLLGTDLVLSEVSVAAEGVPSCVFERPNEGGATWLKQWVNGLSDLRDWDGMDCVQNEGTGLGIIGCRHWQNYRVAARMEVNASKQVGLAVHVQGLQRYYALVFQPGIIKLIKSKDGVQTLAERSFDWDLDGIYDVAIDVLTENDEVHLTGCIDGSQVLTARDAARPLSSGAIGILVQEGRTRVKSVAIHPV